MSVRTVIHLLLILLGAWFVADAAMTVLGHRIEPQEALPVEADSAPPDEEHVERQAPAPRVIVERNLFGPAALGRNNAPAAPRQPERLKAEKRDLGLVLLGTVLSDDSQAVILDVRSRSQDLYRLGAEVRPQHVLREVRRFSAVVSTPTGNVLLAMDDERKPAASAPPRGNRRLRPEARIRPSRDRDDGEEAVVNQRVSLDREVLDESVRRLPELMNEVSVNRVEYDGQEAFRLNNIRPDSLFARLRLKNGDILLGVNGEPLESPGQLMELYASGDEAAVLSLVRRGRKHDITVNFDED